MKGGDNVLRFKSAHDAYEHCRVEREAFGPQWRAALRAGDVVNLRTLAERFRYRVLAVFPREAYGGSWAGANASFANYLYDLSEFENSIEHITEASALYRSVLPDTAPEWHSSLRSINEHCCAELLLRYSELTGDRAALNEASALCDQAVVRKGSEKRRVFATLGAVQRRIAEHEGSVPACDRALQTLHNATADQTPENGDLRWALQRQTFAAVLMLKRRLGGDVDLGPARIAIDEALANYRLNPHDFWIRPSRLDDAIRTKAEIEQGIQQ